MRDEAVDWGKLACLALPSTQATALEAMLWIGEPFSPADLDKMHDEPPGVSAIAYHMRTLASKFHVLEIYEEEQIRGSLRKAYFFRNQTPLSGAMKQAA